MNRLIRILLLILPASLQAQVPLLTLEDALGTAMQNNYDLLLSKNDSLSYALDRSYAYAAFLPRLNATSTKLWNINAQKQELANGSKRDTSGLRSNNLNGSIALNWTVFDGLKMFSTRKRLMELEQLGGINVKAQMVNTVASVTTA